MCEQTHVLLLFQCSTKVIWKRYGGSNVCALVTEWLLMYGQYTNWLNICSNRNTCIHRRSLQWMLVSLILACWVQRWMPATVKLGQLTSVDRLSRANKIRALHKAPRTQYWGAAFSKTSLVCIDNWFLLGHLHAQMHLTSTFSASLHDETTEEKKWHTAAIPFIDPVVTFEGKSQGITRGFSPTLPFLHEVMQVGHPRVQVHGDKCR